MSKDKGSNIRGLTASGIFLDDQALAESGPTMKMVNGMMDIGIDVIESMSISKGDKLTYQSLKFNGRVISEDNICDELNIKGVSIRKAKFTRGQTVPYQFGIDGHGNIIEQCPNGDVKVNGEIINKVRGTSIPSFILDCADIHDKLLKIGDVDNGRKWCEGRR